MANKIKDLKDQRFGKLLVIELIGRDTRRNVTWKCKCDCGNEIITSGILLTMNRKKSCGCLLKDVARSRDNYHGDTGTSLYNMWCRMKQRCNDISLPSYKNYGGRGISYDLHWEDFMNFKKDMIFKYKLARKKYGYNEVLSLERENVNDNYYKKNCIFIPKSEQSKNRRCNNQLFVGISPSGKKFIARNKSEFEKKHNLYYGLISKQLNGNKSKKLKSGWDFKYLI